MNSERECLYLLDGREPNSSDLELFMNNSALMWGMSAFTTALIREGALPFFDAHRDRLISSSNWLWQGDFTEVVKRKWEESCAKLDPELLGSSSWRLRFTLFQDVNKEIHSLLSLAPYQDDLTDGINLILRPDPISYKDRPGSPKVGTYLDRFRAQARENETILFYSDKDMILETAVANIIFYRESDQSFIAPYAENEMILGVGIGHGLRGLNFIEKSVSRLSLSDFDSAFLINSLRGPQPVISLEGREFRVTEELTSLVTQQFEKASRETRRNLWPKENILR